MIRSCHIPPILNRICDDHIHSVLLVTTDGELIGSSTSTTTATSQHHHPSASSSSTSHGPPDRAPAAVTTTLAPPRIKDVESLGALLADVGVDYQRLGEEFAAVDAVQRSKSHLHCLLMEFELGVVGIASCGLGTDCLVVAVADADVPLGWMRSKLQALAGYVQESLSTSVETT